MTGVDSLALYFHTLRHLRPRQIFHRFWRRVHSPRPVVAATPPLRQVDGAWQPPVARATSMVERDEFRFLNEQHRISSAGDWNSPVLSRLWLYNAHYFDDLVAEDASRRGKWHYGLIERWIDENPPGQGCGWEPYPSSLRIVNWIKFHLAGNPLSDKALASLSAQVRFLRGQLEFHLLGNHLLANAKAMILAGCFFSGREAEAWRAVGRRILARQLPEQVLPDGGHVERSPMYHSLVLEDLLDILNVMSAFAQTSPDGLVETINRMRSWLWAMAHPDGDIAFFNDAALSVAPSPSALERYAGRLGLESQRAAGAGTRVLPDSGYVRLEDEACTLLLDVAPVGPDYLPGHAHADTLSFECSIAGQRVIVNSGTSTYDAGKQRRWERSTAAHSTVTVDDRDSSEMWDVFRVARRARPFDCDVDANAGIVTCSHDGYHRLPGRVTHTRRWQLTDGGFAVTDYVQGGWSEAIGRFYIHPAIELTAHPDGQSGVLVGASMPIIEWHVTGARARVQESTYCPEFGRRETSARLELVFSGDTATIEFRYG